MSASAARVREVRVASKASPSVTYRRGVEEMGTWGRGQEMGTWGRGQKMKGRDVW
jgi:hypothetical protein